MIEDVLSFTSLQHIFCPLYRKITIQCNSNMDINITTSIDKAFKFCFSRMRIDVHRVCLDLEMV